MNLHIAETKPINILNPFFNSTVHSHFVSQDRKGIPIGIASETRITRTSIGNYSTFDQLPENKQTELHSIPTTWKFSTGTFPSQLKAPIFQGQNVIIQTERTISVETQNVRLCVKFILIWVKILIGQLSDHNSNIDFRHKNQVNKSQ